MSEAPRLTVIGGGLAGCEAAWQAAQTGVAVELYEMRPHKRGPAHETGLLAELVCSNSLRGAALENAVGLLKEELARCDSLIITAARACAVPAGGALAVDRERFGALVERRLSEHRNVTLHRTEIVTLPPSGSVVIACGPLPSEPLAQAIDALVGSGRLHYFDAAAPIVARESIDESVMYRKSRYDKGAGEDYLNIPLDEAAYQQFVHDLRTLPKHDPKAACRSRRWRRAARTHCASVRSNPSDCAIRAPAARRTPWCNCATRMPPAPRSISSASKPA